MSKKNNYWHKRFELLEDAQHQKATKYIRELDKKYIEALNNIEADITKWYTRLAASENVSLAEAKRLLQANELAEFKWSVEQYIKYGEANALNGQWMRQLENASARVHINRLEAMRIQLQHHIEKLYGEQLNGFEDLMKELYKDQYYHAAYEVQKGIGVAFTIQAIDEKALATIISKPWTADGLNFSQKIWRDKNLLIDTLHKELTQSIARGEAPQRVISVIQKKMNTSRSNAARLVQTEQAFFSAVAQKNAFKELDVEMYEIIATLDSRTSEICQDMDGRVFKLSDYEPGTTANPFHPRCRSSTCPFFSDDYSQRIARKQNGEVYYIDSKIKYPEWKERFVA